MKKHIPKIVIVRGQPRMAEVNFYAQFKNMKVSVVGDKSVGWIQEDKIPKNVRYFDRSLYPVWKFDPWTYFGGVSQTHRSFKFIENLDKVVPDVDIVNISDLFYFYSWQSALLAKKYHKKLVCIVWENVLYHPSTYLPPYCFGVRTVLVNTDLFVARSTKARDYLLSIGAPDNKIKVIYKGIDTSLFRPNVTKRKKGKIVILYVGQLVKSKGLVELLEAFKRLNKEFNNLELVISGKSDREDLASQISELSKSLPIKLLTAVDYHKVFELYQSSNIYCQLSQDWKYLGIFKGGNEWFSYSIMEAMSSGLPIVATRVGGIPEQLGEENGNIYVDQKDVDSVYDGLKKFILNPALRNRVGTSNRLRAIKLFNMKKQAKKTERVIMEFTK